MFLFQMVNPSSDFDDFMRIKTENGSNHLVHFSNKTGTFWVGETNKETRHFLMGLISYRETIFSDYAISINGKKLERNEKTQVEYLPWVLNRFYKGEVSEQVFVPDTFDGMSILLGSPNADTIEYRIFGNQFLEILSIDSLSTPNSITIKTEKNLNKYLTISTDVKLLDARLENGDLAVLVDTKKTEKGHRSTDFILTIGLGGTQEESQRTSILIMSNYESLVAQKKSRIEYLVNSVDFRSADPEVDKAFAWALCSFDALNMNETRTELGKGIYAGYPWFQDYWGRDSFIALRALTITGQFQLAKENLLSFLKYQVQDSTNGNYGKIPNRVRPDESIYNTADATPRFIIEAWKYYQFSKDDEFLRTVLPYVRHAIKGTIQYRTDNLGFLVHGGADTWMDAVGPKGPYSPRGDKANDIQALWIMALESAHQLSQKISREKELTDLTETWLLKVKNAFKEKFINKERNGAVVFDAIDSAGIPSNQIRVNQLCTLPVIDDPLVKAGVVKQVMGELGTMSGPLSLSTKDEWFHPYHKVEPVYEQDASYHNGIIWVWNSGDFVGSLMKYGYPIMGMDIIKSYSERILQDVSLGTLPELYDAIPRHSTWSRAYPDVESFKHISRIDQMALRNEAGFDIEKYPAASGTFSQAWSLSEFIRMINEHLVGLDKVQNRWILNPKVPASLSSYEITLYLEKAELRLEVEKNEYRLTVQNGGGALALAVAVPGSPDVMDLIAAPGLSTYVINVFEQIGKNEAGQKLRLDRKAKFFKDDEAVKEQIKKLNWPNFNDLEPELRKFKSHIE